MQSMTLKAKGRYTSVNELSEVPEGALLEADDVDIASDGIIEPRKGFESIAAFDNLSHRADQIFYFDGKLFAHHGTYLSASELSYYNSGWNSVNSVSAPSGARLHTAKSNQNLYLTTSAGVKVLSAYNDSLRGAGAYKALDVQASLSDTPGFLNSTYSVAYRLLWGYRDANNNLILGAPSGRYVIKNTASGSTGTYRDTYVYTTIPTGVDTNWIFQVYRSTQTTADEPSDELQLVYEGSPTAGSFSSYTKTFAPGDVDTGTETITISSHGFQKGDVVQFTSTGTLPAGLSLNTDYYVISATTNTFKVSIAFEGAARDMTDTGSGTHTVKGTNTIAFKDIVPDSLRGAALYTNATQEGLAYGNEIPPLAKDIAVFNGCLFYANTISKHRFYLTLIAVDGSSGLVADDTVSIGGVTYTAKSSESISSAQFKVTTSGSAAQNIKDTCLSLIKVINRHASSTVYAYYLSGPNDTPGKILLEERDIGGAAFYVTSSRSTCWTPTGIPTSGTAQASSNDTYSNGLSWSKPYQPESVPLVNFKEVGSKDSAILRAVPLKDALILFKEDGVYKLTGSYPNFSEELLDSSAKIIGPETAVVLNNNIYCLTDQGIVAISDGVRVISRPIETDILPMFGDGLSLLKNTAFGVGYESDRKYYLFMPTASSNTYPTVAHVYNTFTQAWVRHKLNKSCGIVESNTLYLGNADSEDIVKERKSYTFTDYADPGPSSNITAQNNETITLDSNVDLITEGDIIYQSSDVFAVITAVDPVANTVTVDAAPTFALSAVSILKAIPSRVVWAPVTLANPGVTKQVHTVELFFKDDFYGTGYLTFQTDITPTETEVPLAGLGLSVWGLFEWGDEPWGGVAVRRPVRQWVPKDYQRCSQLIVGFEHAFAFSPWRLQGISLFGDIGTENVGR